MAQHRPLLEAWYGSGGSGGLPPPPGCVAMGPWGHVCCLLFFIFLFLKYGLETVISLLELNFVSLKVKIESQVINPDCIFWGTGDRIYSNWIYYYELDHLIYL